MSENKNDLKEPLNKNFREPKLRFPEFNETWIETKLGNICNIYVGGEPPKEYIRGISPTKYYKYPIYSNGIGENALWGFSNSYRINVRSITYSSIGTLGHPEIRDPYYTPIIRLKVLVPKNETDLVYLKENLSSKRIGKIGGHVGSINAQYLKTLKIFHTTNNAEQTKIGYLFKKIGDLENLSENKISTLKKYKEGLISALYITCPTKESYPLKYFLNEYSEKNQNNYKAVAVGKNGIRSREEIFSKEIAKDVSKNKVISKNTLIIGMGTKEIDIGILTDDIRLSVSPAYRTFKIKNIDPIYLEQILASENKLLSTRFMIQSARQGKTVDVQGFLNHKIYIHNQKNQEDISKLTMILNDLISVTNKKLDVCTKIKRFLLDNMFI